uniref:Uncharacterized protein n=1 Tax=Sciurus vulgaris TaxID=55149 RepID=A0A8D2AR85_SCIVU
MEQHFLGPVKQAWYSAEVTSEPGPPPVLSLETGGPWPLPCYPVLGEFSFDNCDVDWEQFSSLVGGDAGSTCKTDSAGVQSAWEPTETGSPPPSGPRRRKKLEARADGEEPAGGLDALTLQQVSLRRTRPAGDQPGDTETSARPRLSECPGPVSSNWWNPRLVFSGLLEWIRPVFSTPWGCCPSFSGGEATSDLSGSLSDLTV